MKLILALFILILAPFIGLGILDAQAPLQKVRISVPGNVINYAHVFFGREKGFFREEGLEPMLIQMPSSIAIAASVSGEIDGLLTLASAMRAAMRGTPLRGVAISLNRPLFWLVARPEYRSIKQLKGKVLAVSSINGSQHLLAKALLSMGGLDPDRDITAIQIVDQPSQLLAMTNNAVQVAMLGPPYLNLAREKHNMNILDSAMEKFTSIDSGLAVPLKLLQEKRELVKKMLRARAKSNRYFLENEREASEFISRFYKVDAHIGLETYRAVLPAHLRTGIPIDEDVRKFISEETKFLKLVQRPEPSTLFDFGLQHEVVQELGLK